MKKILGVLAVLVVAFLGTMILINCDRKTRPSYNEGVDSVFVADYVKNVVNPTFTSVDEVINYRQNLCEDDEVTFEFLNIDPNILNTVASVLLKRNSTATKKQIVQEYKANEAIYNNLPPNELELVDNPAPSEKELEIEKDSGMGDQRVTGDDKPQNTVSFHEQDTTINGYKAKVLTRKEVQYE